MIKKYAIIGALIGAAGGFAIQLAVTVYAFLAGPGRPGLTELVVVLLLICIFSVTVAVVGSGGGVIVGVAVAALSRDKK